MPYIEPIILSYTTEELEGLLITANSACLVGSSCGYADNGSSGGNCYAYSDGDVGSCSNGQVIVIPNPPCPSTCYGGFNNV